MASLCFFIRAVARRLLSPDDGKKTCQDGCFLHKEGVQRRQLLSFSCLVILGIGNLYANLFDFILERGPSIKGFVSIFCSIVVNGA